MAKKKFIQKAIRKPGDLTRKAKAQNKTVSQFCADLPENAATRTKRQCALAGTLRKLSKRRKKSR